MADMNIPARNKYQIKIVCQQSSPTESSWKDVLTTDIVTTRTDVVDIAARLQRIFPKPEHLVSVHLLERSGQPLPVAWETPEEPVNGPV
jgi:hypothetical protein